MLRIAICDNDELSLNELENRTKDKLLEKKLPFQEIKKYTKGMDLLAEAQKKAFDLILLEIELPDLDGLEVAKRLQNWGGG